MTDGANHRGVDHEHSEQKNHQCHRGGDGELPPVDGPSLPHVSAHRARQHRECSLDIVGATPRDALHADLHAALATAGGSHGTSTERNIDSTTGLPMLIL